MFLSYNSADGDAVRRIAERLRAERLEPWLDKWALTAGRPWQEEIVEGLSESAACAVLVGPSGLGDWAREELAVAHDQAAKDHDFRLFLVLLPGAPDVSDPRLAFLRTRTWVDLRPGVDDPDAVQDLLLAITGVARGSAAARGDVDDSVAPYRGLASFGEEDAEFFFGRDDATADVLEMLKRSRFVAVLGPSGSGKSSLVRAGVVRRIRAGALPGSEAWPCRVFFPGARPLTMLAAQLSSAFPAESMQATLGQLEKDPRTLDLAVALGLAESPPDRRLVLVADQFEEAFTLCDDEGELKAFIDNLMYAATIPEGRVVVLVGMRADFYHRCAAYPQLAALIASQQYLVSPLSQEGLRQAIREPARTVGVELEAGLLDTILADVGSTQGTLPLLQHVLYELWQRRSGSMLTLAAYVGAGRLEGALAKRANTVYDAFTPEQQEIARHVLLRLVQPGEGTEDTRRRVALDEFVTHADQRQAVVKVVEALAQERLLTSGRDAASGGQVVDITHEALIRGWPELRGWIAEHRDALRAERRLTEAALEWDQSGRDDSLLYRGAHLSAWDDRDTEELNDLERDFLEASRQRQAGERAAGRRRVHIALSGVAAGALLVAVVSLGALSQVARQRDLAQSRVAVANSRAQLDVDSQRALLLALEAYKLRRTPETETAVREAAMRSNLRAQAVVPNPSRPSFTADGDTVIVGAGDGTVQMWNITTPGASPRSFPVQEGAALAAVRPDGSLVATAGPADGTVRLWDAATGAAVRELRGHQGGILTISFSPDGSALASAGIDGTVRIWNARTGEGLQVLPGPPGPTKAAFGPDGNLLVSIATDAAVHVWDWATGRELALLRGHDGLLGDVAFAPDGEHVISSGADGTLRVWEWRTGASTVIQAEKILFSLAVSPDSRFVAAGGPGGDLRIWDWRSASLPRRQAGHTGLVSGVAFSGDGRHLASTSSDGSVRVWEWAKGDAVRVIEMPPVDTVGLSRDGRWMAAGGLNGDLLVWDAMSGTPTRAVHGHAGAITAMGFGPDGLVVTGGFDGTVRVWDAATGEQLRVLPGHGAAVRSVSMSADGRLAASSGFDEAIRVWDWRAGMQVQELRAQGFVNSVAFGHDGTTVLSGGNDGKIRLIEWATATDKVVLSGHAGIVNGASLSPDGRWVVSSSGDGTVRVWDLLSKVAPRVLSGHQGEAGGPEFSRDGNLVVSGGVDGKTIVWEFATGRQLLSLGVHKGPVVARWAPAGRLFLSAGLFDTAQIWDCETCGPTDEMLTLARSRVVRELTAEERRTFIPSTGGSTLHIRPILIGLGLALTTTALAVIVVRSRRSRRIGAPARPS